MIEPWPTTVVRRSCGSGPPRLRDLIALLIVTSPGKRVCLLSPPGPPRRDALMVIVTRPFGRR